MYSDLEPLFVSPKVETMLAGGPAEMVDLEAETVAIVMAQRMVGTADPMEEMEVPVANPLLAELGRKPPLVLSANPLEHYTPVEAEVPE